MSIIVIIVVIVFVDATHILLYHSHYRKLVLFGLWILPYLLLSCSSSYHHYDPIQGSAAQFPCHKVAAGKASIGCHHLDAVTVENIHRDWFNQILEWFSLVVGILGRPHSDNSLDRGILGLQTTTPNHKLIMDWLID